MNNFTDKQSSQLAQRRDISVRFSTSPDLSRGVYNLIQRLISETGLDESGRDRFMLIVGEAIDNAVIHGNKFSPTKFIYINYTLESDKITFMVADQGQGFDYQKHLDTPIEEYQAQNLMAKTMKFGSPGGLGLALMRKCANQVTFTPPGNKVKFVKYL